MSPLEVPVGVDLGEMELIAGLRSTDKTVLAYGLRRGRWVVVKIRKTQQQFWRERFEHESRLYEAFQMFPPPIRVPQLQGTDGHSVLVLEHLTGEPVDTDRYPNQLGETVLDRLLEAVSSFGLWSPPRSVLPPVFDYTSRFARYAADGWFTCADRVALDKLVTAAGPATWCQHGDPLPANVLLTPHSCALVDFEFTGRFVPGWDLALLHTVLARLPGAQRRVARRVDDDGLSEPAWLLNRSMVLARERRLHHELPHTSCGRRARVELLDDEWRSLRRELHAR